MARTLTQASRERYHLLLRGMALLLLSLAQCDDEDGQADFAADLEGDPETADHIVFVAEGQNDPLWPVICAGADRYRADGGSFPLRYLTPEGEQPQDQNLLLTSLEAKRLRGVCVHVSDPEAVHDSLHSLRASGTAVVSIGAGVAQDARSAHVGFDNTIIGRLLADAVAETLANEGSIILMHAGLKDPVCGPRLWTFRERVRLHAGIEVLAEVDCAADPATALALMRDWSRRYPRLSAWVCLDDWPLRQKGTTTAAGLGLPENCRLITFGGWPNHWPLIESGVMPVVVVPADGDFGAKAVRFCEAALLGEQPKRVEDRYTIPVRLLRSRDLGEWMQDWRRWITKPTPSTSPG